MHLEAEPPAQGAHGHRAGAQLFSSGERRSCCGWQRCPAAEMMVQATKDTGQKVLLTSLSRGHITSGSVPDPRQSSDERDESVRCVCEKPISGGLRKGSGSRDDLAQLRRISSWTDLV